MNEIVLKVLQRTVEGLDSLNIVYVIGGSFASSFHGLSRTTNDVDMVVVIEEKQIQLFIAQFEKDFYVDEEMIEFAVRQKSSFNMIHLDTTFKVDMFIAKPGFQENELQRRQLKRVGTNREYSFYFSTPEDIILAKLDWYRKGNSVTSQQWRDISNVIRIQGERLDRDYLRTWASELSLSPLLEQALEESLID